MINQLRREYLQRKAQKSNLEKNIVCAAEDIIIPDERVINPSVQANPFSFNSKHNLPILESLIEQIKEDTEVLTLFNAYIRQYYDSICVYNDVNKLIVLNTLKNIEREIIKNQERNDLYSSTIYFKDFVYVNFENGKPYPKTTSFIDLINKKVSNRRVDNKIVTDGLCKMKIQSSAYILEEQPDFFKKGGCVIKGQASNANENTKQIIFEVSFEKPTLMNRVYIDFGMYDNILCSVSVYSKDIHLNILNEKIDKQKYDKVFEMMEVDRIRIVMSSTANEIEARINRFEMFNDIYNKESTFCTVPIDTNNMPFQIEMNYKEYSDTKIYPLIGMVKDNIITWKAIQNDIIYSYEADYIVVYAKLVGTEHNTPILFDITVNKRIGF